MTVSVQEIGSPGKGVLRFSYLMDESQEFREAFQQGDPAAFQTFYELYRPRLYAYLFRRLRDALEAQEMTQEVLAKAWRSKSLYDPARPLKHWILKIAKNTALDQYKRNSVLKWAEPLEEENVSSRKVNPRIPVDPRGSPEDQCLDQEQDLLWLRLEQTLTPQQRLVIHLRAVEGYSYREISQHLGVTLTSVKCLLYRAKRSLLNQRLSD